MPQPAPQRSPDFTPDASVTVTYANGVFTPSQDPVSIPGGGSVQFTNNSDQDAALELFTKENDKHVMVSVYLAANGGTATLCNDPDDADTSCFYNIQPYPDDGSIIASTSGSHTITITSNLPG
jgi:hypothetical protein